MAGWGIPYRVIPLRVCRNDARYEQCAGGEEEPIDNVTIKTLPECVHFRRKVAIIFISNEPCN